MILDHLPPKTIKLDGKIKDWPGTPAAPEVVKAGKLGVTFVAGYDDKGIWIGADVAKDGPIARTASFGPNEDCVSLIVGFPKQGAGKPGEGLVVHELGIYPGVPGSSSGIAKFRAGPLAGKTVDAADIVESNRAGGGYVVEAFVPWSAFPEATKVRAGLRGALRVYDGDGSKLRAIKASGPGSVESPASLGHLLIEPEQSLPSALAAQKLAFKDATFDVSADFGGDALNERALFFGRRTFVLGPGYKEGKQWVALDFGAEVSAVEARDVTGDGKSDLLVTTRVKSGAVTREALHVWSFSGAKGAETPSRVFAHETLVTSGASGSHALRDVVTFSGGKKPTATITWQPAKGWTVDDYAEPISTDVDPILWPWGAVKERVFAWNGSAFVKSKEVAQKPAAKSEPAASVVAAPPTQPSLPPPSDLVAAAFDQYRKDRGVAPGVAPRIETAANVVPGKKGRAALFGKDLVVAIGDGRYVAITMGRFASDKDVLEITAKDLTGDGREELIVRGFLRAKLTGAGAEKEVRREVLLVYAARPQGSGLALGQVFGAETARAIGKDLVEAQFRIVVAKGSTPGKIELMKGSAKGFTKDSWPFGDEPETPGLEPLLLPWGSTSSVVYAWKGDRFAK